MRFAWFVIAVLAGRIAGGEETQRFMAIDTLAPKPAASDDVQACLDGLCWKPQSFEVNCEPAASEDANHQAVLRFPSPINSGNAVNDRVAVLWYQAPKDDAPGLKPAIVVVHESGSSMPIGKLFARLFAGQGVHAFLVQLPNYGLRRTGNRKPTGDQFLLAMRQGIADVRRTRDAVAALPGIDPARISLQGTSLGGFVASTTAGLDSGFDQVFIMVAGGDLYSMLQSGEREAAELRRRLEEAGFTGEKLRDLMWQVEPTRLAGRMNPDRLWLYSAEHDRVVPIASALALKKAAGLADDHHIRLPGDHVTTVVYVPVILDHVIKRIREEKP
ncbi:esterase [Caulifigura coniformis]|uniref:Esterase n=1 Tax=Caulifigura coniformis TaxID=2527983 RepID=A0A517SLD4_9PLAN|nr:alpha/beta fold hydrolase [Caulifigura coniformis]QDT56928.1 esterase [Caulifigura coniformis]